MTERTQHGVKKGTAFNTQWISDLTEIFGSGNVTTENNVTTVNLTSTQGETFNIQSVFSNDITTVTLHYGTTTAEITDSNASNWIAYRLIKFDNGVIAFSGFQMASAAENLDAHTNAKRLVWFVCNVTNIITSATTKAIFKAIGTSEDPDSVIYYQSYIATVNSVIPTFFNEGGQNVVNAPITILSPVYIRSLPLIATGIWLKTQSTGAYNVTEMGDKTYLSCATFCVPLGV